MKTLYRHLVVAGFFLLVFSNANDSYGQFIPHHTDHEDLYNFLSELRIRGIVEYNPAVLPLSRKEIADMLVRADTSTGLNNVQKKELAFWLREFGKDLGSGKVKKKKKFFSTRTYQDRDIKKRLDLFYFANDLFQVTVNPIIGGVGGVNRDGNLTRHQFWGGEVFGRIGKGFGFYFNARDYLEQPNWNGAPNISPELGGVFRKSGTVDNGIEYYELRGGVTYGWKWGQVGIVKDHLELGSAQTSQIILSNRAPSIPRFHLQLKPVKWVELTYTFGWLNSELVDSARSYNTGNGVYRELFHQKFLVANMVTIRPWKYISLGVGSSIIVSDNNINAGHFIPIMFYTALDQSFNGQSNKAGQNSQLYADLSWDVFGFGQLYGSILIDEIRLSTMFDREKQRNSVAYQVGLRSRVFTPWNLKVYGSYTRIRPAVYNHYIPTTTYAHAGYGLGHFLGENSDQLIAGIQLRPVAKMRIILEYQRWRKGAQHVFGNNASNLSGAQFMQATLASTDRINFRVRYQLINGLVFQLSADYIEGNSNGVYQFQGMEKLGRTSDVWFGLGIQVGL
jgi:hypothetical protein